MRKLFQSLGLVGSLFAASNAEASRDFCDDLFDATGGSAPIMAPLSKVYPMSTNPFKHKSTSGNQYNGSVSVNSPDILAGIKQIIAQGAGGQLCQIEVVKSSVPITLYTMVEFRNLKERNGKVKKNKVIKQTVEETSKTSNLLLSLPSRPDLGKVPALLNIRLVRKLPDNPQLNPFHEMGHQKLNGLFHGLIQHGNLLGRVNNNNHLMLGQTPAPEPTIPGRFTRDQLVGWMEALVAQKGWGDAKLLAKSIPKTFDIYAYYEANKAVIDANAKDKGCDPLIYATYVCAWERSK